MVFSPARTEGRVRPGHSVLSELHSAPSTHSVPGPRFSLLLLLGTPARSGAVKTYVCIKRVPDTEARLKVAADGRSIDTTGLKYIISPYDEYALEAALRQKEASGAGDVVVVSVGDSSAGEQLRSALAMGADAAVLLKGQAETD